jgi:hypothetical protein
MGLRASYIDWFYKMLNLNLPEFQTLDAYIDFILPHIKPFSEDLHETHFYTEKPWFEIRDDPHFVTSVLHIFKDEKGQNTTTPDTDVPYLRAVDGNVAQGTWSYLRRHNSSILLLKIGGEHELYIREFINPDFFILRKHGNSPLDGRRKYFVLGLEGRVANLEWRECVELLFNIHRFRIQFILFAVIIVVVVVLLLMLSF